MAVTFSDEVMRAMGFREFAVGESVAAAFSRAAAKTECNT